MKKMNHAIRELREARGLTQVQLAELAGLTQSHLSKVEADGTQTPARVYQQIADALGLSLGDLFDAERHAQEQLLIEAFRALPPERQKGWLDMAQLVRADLKEASKQG